MAAEIEREVFLGGNVRRGVLWSEKTLDPKNFRTKELSNQGAFAQKNKTPLREAVAGFTCFSTAVLSCCYCCYFSCSVPVVVFIFGKIKEAIYFCSCACVILFLLCTKYSDTCANVLFSNKNKRLCFLLLCGNDIVTGSVTRNVTWGIGCYGETLMSTILEVGID